METVLITGINGSIGRRTAEKHRENRRGDQQFHSLSHDRSSRFIRLSIVRQTASVFGFAVSPILSTSPLHWFSNGYQRYVTTHFWK